MQFIKDIYLQNNCDIRDIERGREDMEGRLVSVEGDPRVFGRVKFYVTIMKESLKAVKINDDYAARYRDFIKDKVFFKNVVGEENVIIVKSKYVKLFKEDFKFIRGSDIFIDPESIKVKEGCDFRKIKKGDIVRYENRGERCYGRIERVELWNDVRCVSVVNTMKVREQDDEEEKYIKEDKVTKVSESLEYIQDPIIDPNSIVTFKEIKDEDLSVGDEVEFKLKMNLQKFTGNIVMIIEANDVPSAIVELDISSTDDFPSHFISFNEFFDKVNLLMPSNTVIVLLKKIKKLNGEEKCLNLIFDFIKNKEVGVNILVELLSKSDTRFVKNLIKEWNHPINLECYPDLLPKLINDGEYDIISTLFNHFVFSEENNFHILKIIKYFLFRKDFSLFNAACKKCLNVNVIMDDGETFLTNVIKESDDEDIICRVIGTNIFDINKTNQDGESPLMLVCRKLMLSCVRLLMSNGVNISYQNNIALNIVIDQENNETNVVRLIFCYHNFTYN